MPELPEVETVVQQLRPILRGAAVAAVKLCLPAFVRLGSDRIESDLPGRRITEITRRGKWIILSLSPAGRLVIHLGMSGRLTLEDAAAPLLPHTHLILRLRGASLELRHRDPRRFGGAWFEPQVTGDSSRIIPPLGPDALTIRVPLLRGILARRRAVKAILMDQQRIAGLGNIYCDEALHRAGIHPLAPADQLQDQRVRRLACAIRSVLKQAIASGGSSLRDYRQANGDEGAFQNLHRVYDREGRPCGECGEVIRRLMAAGRSSYFCPRCQPLPPGKRRRPVD